MGKGANKQLLSNAGQGQQQQQKLSGSASDISSSLTPQLESDVTNPKGYTPQQLAYMNTASQQSEGGSVGGTTGQANLTAARTRNAGGYQGAIASSARSAQKSLSQNALSIQQQQANLQQQQRQAAIDALSKLYGIDEQTALGYLNQSDTALNQENQSHPNQQGLLTAGTFISDLGNGAKGAAALKG